MTYFKGIEKIGYEGPETDNLMAFRWYNPDQVIAGKTMKDHFKFAMAYWHTLGNTGGDPFGLGTKVYPWSQFSDPMDRAKHKLDAAFEFLDITGIDYFCFHDYDLVEEASDFSTSEKRLFSIVEQAKGYLKSSGKKVLWGTANLFSHPRYMNGAATNPDFSIVSMAAAQVKNALEATIQLNGENYVFWGGREGYLTLLNTDMKREQDHMAMFLSMARDYARSLGFKGTFFIEPKPMEPSKHQYDYDAATVIGFLQRYNLQDDFKLNIEVNHATLAGHTFQHELMVAANAGMLGSIDANRGDYQNGWDTDQFPNNVLEIAEAMLVLLEHGGLKGGGINFDAKTRRNSTDLADLIYAHIGGMDVFARGLIAADKLMSDPNYIQFRKERYSSFDKGKGSEFEKGKLKLQDLYQFAVQSREPEPKSGKQEYLENLLNRYI